MAQCAPPFDLAKVSMEELLCFYDRHGPFPISDAEYMSLALDHYKITWELHNGWLVEKPGGSWLHGDLSLYLSFEIANQVERNQYHLRAHNGRISSPGHTYFIPAVMVIPTALFGTENHDSEWLERYDAPLPFVAESTSTLTDQYDVTTKLPVYRARGDREIWHMFPEERRVMIRRRRDGARYDEQTVTGGRIELHALPWVVIDLDALFDLFEF